MKLRYFNYMPTDCKAMEDELNRMARKGWELQKLRFGFASFAPTARTGLCYTVEPAPRGQEVDEWRDWEYRLLCADAGWEVAAQSRTFRVFASKEGTQPLPMDTDSALAYREKWARPLLRDGLNYLFLGVLYLFFYVPQGFPLDTWYSPYYLALFLLASVWAFFCGGWTLWTRRKFRLAAENGESLPAVSSRFALLRGFLRDLLVLFLLVLLLLLLSDCFRHG